MLRQGLRSLCGLRRGLALTQRVSAPFAPLRTFCSSPAATGAAAAAPAVTVKPKAPRVKPSNVNVTFLNKDGTEKTVVAVTGQSILDVAHAYDIDLEGACEASLACSTCHVIFTTEVYKSLPPASDEENDMLDLALGVTETSRLGCQIIITKEMEGMRIRLPEAVKNNQVK
eukprot:gnl/Hemi2/22111_TR7367_c0_g1_i1.p1 gnl/Hemi2/22111_TR7367_c0_g1~~gnl/Hemi2/22111_TR7367_c0_g1_i1.p1  ORF type:complete len:171 (-),score=31.95 gnl/Hemi2/22111_TR7367_c0_g1_i1:149-661(-)